MEMGQYLRVLARRKWIVVAAAILAAAAAFATTYAQKPVYRATATLAIPTTPGAADVIAGSGRRSSDSAQETAQLQLLKLQSRLLATEVIQKLKLPMTPDSLLAMVSAEADPNAPSAFSVTVSDSSPRRSAAIANAYADGLVSMDASQSAKDLTHAIKELDRKLAAYDRDIRLLSARMDAAQARSRYLRTPADGAPPASAAVKTRVYAQWVKLTTAYNTLAQKKDELVLIRAAIGTPIQVIEYAVAPGAPTGENPMSRGALGLLFGLMLGVGGVFTIEYFDDALRTKDEIEKHFASPVIGELEKEEPGREKGVVMKTQPTSRAADAYRLLRTNLLLKSRQQSAASLLLTQVFSDGPVAPVVVNLATSLAQAGYRVAVVCSNRKEGGCASYLGVNGDAKGLSDWLIEGGSVNGYLLETKLDGVRLMPPGKEVGNFRELLGGQAMEMLPKVLSDGHHFVLLDAPPVLEGADASVLAQGVDGVLLVAGPSGLNAAAAEQARERLAGARGRLLGVVVVR
ncbi:MAG: hypothetical protein C4521_13060 [Actinobacteria bacterium]|nr:MAG: hypothetical protein C4521_13060 [Actinomycetota bacterium]